MVQELIHSLAMVQTKLRVGQSNNMFSARITQISEVDSSGLFEVTFEVLKDGEVLFERLTRKGLEKEVLIGEIETYLKEVKQQHEEVEKFQVGEVISI
jgi:hypothetical protein